MPKRTLLLLAIFLLMLITGATFAVRSDGGLLAAVSNVRLRMPGAFKPSPKPMPPVQGPSPEVLAYIRQQLATASAGESSGGPKGKGPPPGEPGCCLETSCYEWVEYDCNQKDCSGKIAYRIYECVPGASSYTCSDKIVSEFTFGCYDFFPCDDCGEYVCSLNFNWANGGACTAANECKQTWDVQKCGDPKKFQCLNSGQQMEGGCQNPPGSPECAQKCVSGCGDGICKKPPESCGTCPKDCGACPPPPPPKCGDKQCNGIETCKTCPKDCGSCPVCKIDGICDKSKDPPEDCLNCSKDCGVCPPTSFCGNRTCDLDIIFAPESCVTCPKDCGVCVCGDLKCTTGAGESCKSCPLDCGACPPPPPTKWCGDKQCNGTETCKNCSKDCGVCPVCGDGVCKQSECSECAADCKGSGICPRFCGDGLCISPESCTTCAVDCIGSPACPGVCGDKKCGGSETCKSCPEDCGVCPPPPPPLSCTGPTVQGCPLKTDSCKLNKCYRKNIFGQVTVVPNSRCSCKAK